MVAGVAAGLADALGLDPNVVRCGFVVLAISPVLSDAVGAVDPMPSRAQPYFSA